MRLQQTDSVTYKAFFTQQGLLILSFIIDMSEKIVKISFNLCTNGRPETLPGMSGS